MPFNRRRFLGTGATLVASTVVARRFLGQAITASSLKGNLDKVLSAIIERGDVPGVVAAVTSPDETVYLGAFGERGLGQGVAMTPDRVFYLASMTKPITTTAAMQLVEQGKLELDAPISKWVPEAANLQVLDGWGASGRPILRAPKRLVMLRDLLTHTSGFAYGLWDADLARYMTEEKFPDLSSGEEAAFYPPLMFDPGVPKSWGLSFMINEETAPTGRPTGSLAWAGVQNTFFWIDPSTGLGGVYLTQILPFVDEKGLATFYEFETAVYQA